MRHRGAHLGQRVGHRPLALRHGDVGEVLARRAVREHVPAGGEGVHAVGAWMPVAAIMPRHPAGALRAAVGRAGPAPLRQRRVTEDARNDLSHARLRPPCTRW